MRLFDKRRSVLLDNFQVRLLVINLVYFLAIILVCAIMLFGPAVLDLQNETISWDLRHEAATQFLSLHTRLWPAMIVLFLLLTIHSIRVSHRIAGPLFRFRQTFESVAEGDLKVRVTLRHRDYLVREAGSINDMLEGLSERIRSIQDRSDDIVALTADLRTSIHGDSTATLEQRAIELESQLARLRADLQQFKTRSSEVPGERESSEDRPSAN